MINLIVCRGAVGSGCPLSDPNLNWGDDVVNELLNTDAAAQERGRAEIDGSYTNRKIRTASLHDLTFIQPGGVYGLTDYSTTKNGILKSFQLSVSMDSDNSFSAQSIIILETDV